MGPTTRAGQLASLYELFASLMGDVPSATRRKHVEGLQKLIVQKHPSAGKRGITVAPISTDDNNLFSPGTQNVVESWYSMLALRIGALWGEGAALCDEGWLAVHCFLNQSIDTIANDEVAYAVALMGGPSFTAAASPTSLETAGCGSEPPFCSEPAAHVSIHPNDATSPNQADTAWSLSSAAGLACMMESATTPIDVRGIYEALLGDASALPQQAELEELLRLGAEAFKQETNIVEVSLPAVVIGDVHGQWRDMRERILPAAGSLADLRTGTSYLFLGDYVDRGESGLHTLAFLVSAKILFPDRVFLIRGNHEFRNTNGCYGFLNECHAKYPPEGTTSAQPAAPNDGSSNSGYFGAFGGFLMGMQQKAPNAVWTTANQLFDQLPIAAIVGEKIFCVHGGLSPKAPHIASIVACPRGGDAASGSGMLGDLTWSDPCEEPGWATNHRGCGQLFGPDVTEQFIERHNFSFVCRAHQCVRGGYLWSHKNKLLTLFSAPNYCNQGNDGAVMKVTVAGDVTFVTYRSSLSFEDDELCRAGFFVPLQPLHNTPNNKNCQSKNPNQTSTERASQRRWNHLPRRHKSARNRVGQSKSA